MEALTPELLARCTVGHTSLGKEVVSEVVRWGQGHCPRFLQGPALQAGLLPRCPAQLCTGKWPLSPSPGLCPATRPVLKP